MFRESFKPCRVFKKMKCVLKSSNRKKTANICKWYLPNLMNWNRNHCLFAGRLFVSTVRWHFSQCNCLYRWWLLVNSHLYITRIALRTKVATSRTLKHAPDIPYPVSCFLLLSLALLHICTHIQAQAYFFGVTAVIVDVINVFLSASFWEYYEFIGVNFHPGTLHVAPGILIELLPLLCSCCCCCCCYCCWLVFITVPFRTVSRFFN